MRPLHVLALLMASPAYSDVAIQFVEGAPKDQFVITNVGDCNLAKAKVNINFNGSSGGLIFDVTASGAGVEVFQPLEILEGSKLLSDIPVVKDGDKEIAFDLSNFPAGQRLKFTIDVDDTVASREITVANSELTGTTVKVTSLNGNYVGTFGKSPEVLVPINAC